MIAPTSPDPMPLRRNSHARLRDLLEEISERPEAEAELTATIERDFGETRAILVLDMSGFSRCTEQNGIVCFLLMIHQMKRLAVPAVEEAGGILVKAEADNLLCLFEDVDAAIGAAREILRRLDEANADTPADRHLGAAIGIGFGHVLNVDERDLFGHEVNLACKLGEDIAKEGEILLTAAANERALVRGFDTSAEQTSISNLDLSYFRIA